MKSFIFTILLGLFSIETFAQKNTFQLSSHILDVSKGIPASGVKIKLEKYNNQSKIWTFVEEKNTDVNGRISDFLPSEKDNLGIFKLTYYTSDYFKNDNIESFYPFIEVVFKIRDKNHYHVPITLSAYGYSTYRGS
ncbi:MULTISPECIES: hydroxyisourate hydrolase [unclassified Chryseobacterium]|jgi:5-hydroxyisourate hydrolase|uniref:hydroxyisourate hydrolase n=1 Tax=unclassified Chryseobacterium TaxID=2593645 RepID=UPI000805E942|nr:MULTISPECIES: hydroxyisourate hydrolase [unclassified Chryseobacterium]MBW3524845.1 hydroxyisourate hydrolase [Chryseobacterium sp. NKUCC03_KSP]OBW39618.1 5-hydroxyisourate hydrolase precursor [Chryseobacterium sp. MOF25P]OBW46513.1 5-hydroxyisourate hydrolase precursor [Chryseobacterium sp. BGARF1]